MEIARMRKAASAHVPHRTDFSFYMSGRSAQLFRKGELSREEVEQLKQSSLSPNSALYYGHGVRSSRPHSKAVQDFEKKLQAMTDSEAEGGGDGVMDDEMKQSQPVTPTPSQIGRAHV